MNSHQNKKEALLIFEVIRNLNYNIVVSSPSSKNVPIKNYDLIFGIEPNFVKFSKLNPFAKKIYYATGAYIDHQNKMITDRTDSFNKKYNKKLPYKRLIDKHYSSEMADKILQIGSKFTIFTYPECLREKIIILNQSSHDFKLNSHRKNVIKNTFLWFGSSGFILKGVDLVLDYFINHQEYILHIVGPIEKEFKDVYSHIPSNIKFHGFLDIDGREILDIVDKSTFIIYPSGSEGIPGSVLNMMKLGLIPIVSKWAACNEIEKLGYLLEDLSLEEINRGIEWSQKLSDEEIIKLSVLNQKYVVNNYDLEGFKDRFSKALSVSLVK